MIPDFGLLSQAESLLNPTMLASLEYYQPDSLLLHKIIFWLQAMIYTVWICNKKPDKKLSNI